MICETDEGSFTEDQNCFRGGKKEPLTINDIEKKYEANVKFSKMSAEEIKNLNSFISNIFKSPDFSKINF